MRSQENSTPETWRPIAGYEGRYSVSNFGRVRSELRKVTSYGGRSYWIEERLIKPDLSRGYLRARLLKNRRYKAVMVHRLVLEAFVGKCPVGQECRHLDGDKENNNVGNLLWGTKEENYRDRDAHQMTAKGERHGRSRLTEVDIIEVRGSSKTLRELSLQFGVSMSHISRIRKNQAWAHL